MIRSGRSRGRCSPSAPMSSFMTSRAASYDPHAVRQVRSRRMALRRMLQENGPQISRDRVTDHRTNKFALGGRIHEESCIKSAIYRANS